ncbi:hypothetical protein QUF76_02795 [Desulfobacterales bacterium HSG16]|nr:hypothetical protein [Desulfobacterales bacterium HSG16]
MLLIDCGGIFADDSKDKLMRADISLQAMNIMRYDAMNIGSMDFIFGTEYLDKRSSEISFPYISSNLEFDPKDFPSVSPYVIKKVGKIKIAILGVLPEDGFDKLPANARNEKIRIISPEKGLAEVLKQVKGKSDIVVLLSNLDYDSNIALSKQFESIDIVLSSGNNSSCHDHGEDKDKGNKDKGEGKDNKISETAKVFQIPTQGKYIGQLQVSIKENGGIEVTMNKQIKLGNSVPANKRITEIINARVAKTWSDKRQEARKKAFDKMHEELREGLKQTPEEFFKKYQKEREQYNKNSLRKKAFGKKHEELMKGLKQHPEESSRKPQKEQEQYNKNSKQGGDSK